MKKLIALLALFSLNLLPASEEEVPVVILGGGVGAMTAANYLARAGIPPVVVSGPLPGGAILQSAAIQNWPGELQISGFELAGKIQKQAQESGAHFLPEIAVSVDFSKRPFVITTKKPFQNTTKVRTIKARTCILALGATPNFLGVPGEWGQNSYWLRGVYNCAVCDGALYKDKVVAVVGGGDSALVEAQYLSNIAKKVYVVVRKDQFKTIEEARKEEILKKPNVEVLYNTTIREVRGNGQKMTALLLNNGSELAADALFLAIGSAPNSDLLKGQVDLDKGGYVVLKNIQETSVPGVFALGDLSDPVFKQAITASGDAAKAAYQAQKYLTSYKGMENRQEGAAPRLLKPANIGHVSTKADLDRELKAASGPVFLYFSSPHCGPCRFFSLDYEQWAKEFESKVRFLKTDASHSTELFNLYQISGIPTLLVLDGKGSVIRTAIGLEETAEIAQRLENLKEGAAMDPHAFR